MKGHLKDTTFIFIFLGLILTFSVGMYDIYSVDKDFINTREIKNIGEKLEYFYSKKFEEKVNKAIIENGDLNEQYKELSQNIESLPESSFPLRKKILPKINDIVKREKKNISQILRGIHRGVNEVHQISVKSKMKTVAKITENLRDDLKLTKNSLVLKNITKQQQKIEKDVSYLNRILKIESQSNNIKNILNDVSSGNEDLKIALKNAKKLQGKFFDIRKSVQKIRNNINLEVDYDLLKASERQSIVKRVFQSLGIFILISLIVYGMIFFYEKKKQESIFEDRFWLIVKNYILNNTGDIKKLKINERFQSELINCRSYYNKRLSFGTLFQESIPFPTAVFSQNNSNIWCNTEFVDFFKENLNCDQVQDWGQFIQVLGVDQSKHDQKQSFTVSYNKKEFTVQVEEVLHDQEKFKMTYIMTSNDSSAKVGEMNENINFVLESILKREYIPKSADVDPDVLLQLNKVNDVITQLEQDFSSQIESVENLNVDYFKCLNDVSKMLSRPVNGMQQISQDFKKDFVGLVEVRDELNEQIDRMMDSYYLTKNKHQETILEIESLVKSLMNFSETNPGFSQEINDIITNIAQVEYSVSDAKGIDEIPQLIERSQNLEEELTNKINILLGEASERQKIIERVKVLVSENAEIKQYDV